MSSARLRAPADASAQCPLMDTARTVELRDVAPSSSLPGYIAEVWRRREFAYLLARGSLSAENQDSALGGLWHLLNPLLLAAVYYLVFGVIFGGTRGVENYPAFMVIGLFTFHFTNKMVGGGTRSMVGSQSLLANVAFPRALLPVAAMLQEASAHLISFVAMFALVLATGVTPSFAWLLVIPTLVLQAIFNLGLALTVARLAFHLRDVQQLIPYVLRIWLYLSGVFFPVSFVLDRAPGPLLLVWLANPLHQFMELSRLAVLDGTTDASLWVGATCWSLASLAFGVSFFRAREQEYSRG